MHVLKPVSWAPSQQVDILSALCWVAAVMLTIPQLHQGGRSSVHKEVCRTFHKTVENCN